ncbi:MAG: hypothetical protein M1821_008154 [Bathelium mastoideum]|nr:MAG: hypothetical protein M1821_008154 [Bathelium mastoideum]
MSAWLRRQNKGELQHLADESGFSVPDAMRKNDLADALDKHLQGNASHLSSKPSLSDYYGRSSSPVKKEPSNGLKTASADDPDTKVAKKPGRRKTIKEEDLDSAGESSPSSALATRTPRAVQRIAEHVPLPASPAQITDAIDRQSVAFQASVSAFVDWTGFADTVESLRDGLSSVDAVGTLIALFEGLALSRTTMPWRHAFSLPPNEVLRTPKIPIYLPDLFQLVTPHFWYTSIVWGSSTLLAPLLFAYFFNFTLKASPAQGAKRLEYRVDPLVFHLTKLVVTMTVYWGSSRAFGTISDDVIKDINEHILGGPAGMMTGAFIGILTSIYEAILRK